MNGAEDGAAHLGHSPRPMPFYSIQAHHGCGEMSFGQALILPRMQTVSFVYCPAQGVCLVYWLTAGCGNLGRHATLT